MSDRRVLTLYPYLLNGTCWVFDDERTGLKEEAFVMGMTEMISRVVEAKGLRGAATGFALSFSDEPPRRIFVRCDPLPAGVNPIWTPKHGDTPRQFVEPPPPATVSPGARYGEITAQLRELEHKTDPESCRLYAELIDELICVDMALQPGRQAMARSHKQKNEEK